MQKRNFVLFIVIIILTFFLRFYKLGEVPHGMAWDEAAIAYNGFAIFNTRRDEWLQKLPISFRSFGDYKAPLAIYESGFFTRFFGMNLWAVRLPFAIHGTLAVVGIYVLIKEIFYKDKKKQMWALIGAFLLSISPWHIHYSRLAFESGIALNLLIWAVYFFYLFLRSEKKIALFLAAILSSLSIYAYHSNKVTVPVLFIFLFLQNISFFKKRIKEVTLAIAFATIILSPFLYDALFANGLTRAATTIFGQGYNFVDLLKVLVKNFFSYFSLNFLIFGENMGNFRHGDGKFGVVEPISLALILIYLFLKKKDKKIFYLSLIMLFSGLLPAVISDGKSSSNRSILALPGVILLTTVAIQTIFEKIKFKNFFITMILAGYLLGLIAYQLNYYQHYVKDSTESFMDGYLETFAYLKSMDKKNIKQIVFTNDYQQAYIYALFSFAVNPIAYQGGILNLFLFTDKIDAGDLEKTNTIVVASQFDQMGTRKADKIINGSNGAGRFFVYLPL